MYKIFSGSPFDRLESLRSVLEEEMNSTTNALRNTFMNKIPTQEDIDRTCNDLAEKLSLNDASKNEVKIALVDVLEEALQGNVYGIIATKHRLIDVD